MDTIRMPLAEVRNNLSQIIRLLEGGGSVLITKHGRPAVHLVHSDTVRELEYQISRLSAQAEEKIGKGDFRPQPTQPPARTAPRPASKPAAAQAQPVTIAEGAALTADELALLREIVDLIKQSRR